MIISAAADPAAAGSVIINVDTETAVMPAGSTLTVVREDVLTGEQATVVSGVPVAGDLLGGQGAMEGSSGFAPQGTSTVTYDTTRFHSGSRSMRLRSGGLAGANTALQTTTNKVQVGKRYLFAAWCWIPTGTNMGSNALDITNIRFDPSVFRGSSPATRDGWVRVVVKTSAAVYGGTDSTRLQLYPANTAGQDVWWDDATFQELLEYSDRTVPLGRAVIYRATIGTVTATSQPLTLSGALPLLSDIAGQTVLATTIYDWPELTVESQSKIIRVPGRRSPVVLSGVGQTPDSTITFVTRTAAELAAFRELADSGQPLLVRAPCAAVEAATFVISRRTERRRTKKGSDWTRLHVCEVTHLEQQA